MACESNLFWIGLAAVQLGGTSACGSRSSDPFRLDFRRIISGLRLPGPFRWRSHAPFLSKAPASSHPILERQPSLASDTRRDLPNGTRFQIRIRRITARERSPSEANPRGLQ